MREVELLLKACNWGNNTLKITRTHDNKLNFWSVDIISGYKVIIHFYNTTAQGDVIMSQYWLFVMFNGQLSYYNGFGFNWFLKRYEQTIKDKDSYVELKKSKC